MYLFGAVTGLIIHCFFVCLYKWLCFVSRFLSKITLIIGIISLQVGQNPHILKWRLSLLKCRGFLGFFFPERKRDPLHFVNIWSWVFYSSISKYSFRAHTQACTYCPIHLVLRGIHYIIVWLFNVYLDMYQSCFVYFKIQFSTVNNSYI